MEARNPLKRTSAMVSILLSGIDEMKMINKFQGEQDTEVFYKK